MRQLKIGVFFADTTFETQSQRNYDGDESAKHVERRETRCRMTNNHPIPTTTATAQVRSRKRSASAVRCRWRRRELRRPPARCQIRSLAGSDLHPGRDSDTKHVPWSTSWRQWWCRHNDCRRQKTIGDRRTARLSLQTVNITIIIIFIFIIIIIRAVIVIITIVRLLGVYHVY